MNKFALTSVLLSVSLLAGCSANGINTKSIDNNHANNVLHGSGVQAPNARSGPALGGASNARSGPASGGASGTVDSVSTSSFTMTTLAGAKVTVNEATSTKYKKGTSSTSASAITTGERVLVLGTTSVLFGTTSGITITATQVNVQPTQVGQIPANYVEGSGTIVSGTAANKATEAGLTAYPGGVVDRVVQLSNGEYEVHNVTVKWPHHIFVNKHFKVVGAF
jgi:hypothetical protein